MLEEFLDRVSKRLPEEKNTFLVKEIVQTIIDRLLLRLGVEKLPKVFESIVVDASVKMYRRTYYEGISSENVEGLSTAFVEDILSEYAPEIEQWREDHKAELSEQSKGALRFL